MEFALGDKKSCSWQLFSFTVLSVKCRLSTFTLKRCLTIFLIGRGGGI